MAGYKEVDQEELDNHFDNDFKSAMKKVYNVTIYYFLISQAHANCYEIVYNSYP